MTSKAAFLSSCRAKIVRADHHLETLYREIDVWSELRPSSFSRQSNTDGSVHIFRIHFSPKPDLWRWALLMGDALHNLRCALDHIVYSLAIRHTGKDPPDDDARLAFPITSSVENFAKAKWRIRSLPDRAQAGIEKAQPYNRTHPTGWEPLWWLAQLNDVDKHRLTTLSPIAAWPEGVTISADPGSYEVYWNPGVYMDGSPVLWIKLANPDPNLPVGLRMTGGVVIKVEDQPAIGIIPSLKSIRHETVLVCRYMAMFF